ncbi:MAG: hypothetical protein IPI91_17705 [Flavobacteriales bacterium]|nr:hypothetical protein [Flavobacteriales bacterium]
MHRSPIGELAQRCWDAIPEHMPHMDIDAFVVMPNHVHGIVVIRERLQQPERVGPDHDRADTITSDTITSDVVTHDTATPDATPDVPPPENADHGDHGTSTNDDTGNAPYAQTRTDRDRSLRLPTDPPAPTTRVMPIVAHGSLGRIVRAFKSSVTRIAYRDASLPRGTPVWQHNYWDRIIRDQAEWMRIAKYIRGNPANWGKDRFHR